MVELLLLALGFDSLKGAGGGASWVGEATRTRAGYEKLTGDSQLSELVLSSCIGSCGFGNAWAARAGCTFGCDMTVSEDLILSRFPTFAAPYHAPDC